MLNHPLFIHPLTLSILYNPRYRNRPQARLGKAYYQLGMLRDAEKQFLSSLKQQEMVLTYLELAKVYLKLDQPNSALDMYACFLRRKHTST